MIVILRGHLNVAASIRRPRIRCLSDRNPTWPLEPKLAMELMNQKVSVIVILRGHLNSTNIQNMTFDSVSVIVILRGHLNVDRPDETNCRIRLSDRNPTWPLEQLIVLPKSRVYEVSVIVILRGHLNLFLLKKWLNKKVSVIVILRGHLNSLGNG